MDIITLHISIDLVHSSKILTIQQSLPRGVSSVGNLLGPSTYSKKSLLFPLQTQMDHILPCLSRNLLCCYQLYSFVNKEKSCGFVKANGFMIFYESVEKALFLRPATFPDSSGKLHDC